MFESLPIPLPIENEKKNTQISQTSELEIPTDAPNFSPDLEKRAVRKCDLRVIPPLMLMMMLAFLDRVNVGNASIQGLEKNLDMSGSDFNAALAIFFVPFILFEVPANLILKRVKPSRWLSFLLF